MIVQMYLLLMALYDINGTQNPSLTFMAITARAANYAADELKKEIYNQ